MLLIIIWQSLSVKLKRAVEGREVPSMLLVKLLVALLVISLAVPREVHGRGGFAGVGEGVGEVSPVAVLPEFQVSTYHHLFTIKKEMNKEENSMIGLKRERKRYIHAMIVRILLQGDGLS